MTLMRLLETGLDVMDGVKHGVEIDRADRSAAEFRATPGRHARACWIATETP